MIKDVLIDIKGTQGIDGSTDTIEFTSEGRFGMNDGEFFISYDEGQMFEESVNVKTRILIKKDKTVALERKGAINSKMLIEEGKRNSCFYNTPIGDLVISIFGEKIEYDLTENGGNLNLQYTIDSDMKMISRNQVNISVREVN
ncbi:MAG: DUF1934 domain-containing protein [Clostridia bacterium]|nr:DUF1934 domain-containing protein [Clostridia bacterium]MBR4973041.1 DUF1934 domain-containing protein [Clostridia bacterium]